MSPPSGEGVGRGRTWNGVRSPTPRYPGSPIRKPRQLIDSAGHPIRPKWHQDRQEEGVIMSSPPPGDLPPEMSAPPVQEDLLLVNGIEHLSVNGQLETENKSMPITAGGSQVHQYQQPYHPHPMPYCPPQMPIHTQQLQQQPQPAPANGSQQVLYPVYPYIPLSYSDITSGHVNLNYGLSQDPNGSDLPLSDLPTVRFFYNLGQNYYRWYSCIASYSQLPTGRMESLQSTNPLGKLDNQDRKCSIGQYSYRETVVRGRTYRSSFISETSSHTVRSESSNSDDVLDKKSVSCTHSDSGCDSESSYVGDSANENAATCSLKSESPCTDLTGDDGSVEEDSNSDSSVNNNHKTLSEKSDKELQESEESPRNNTDSISETETGTGNMPKQSQRKYYTWGPYKLLKPIKDIPPRFQQMLAETNAQKARCEGIPIVYQCDPNLMYSSDNAYSSAFREEDMTESQLNPTAPDFKPADRPREAGESGPKLASSSFQVSTKDTQGINNSIGSGSTVIYNPMYDNAYHNASYFPHVRPPPLPPSYQLMLPSAPLPPPLVSQPPPLAIPHPPPASASAPGEMSRPATCYYQVVTHCHPPAQPQPPPPPPQHYSAPTSSCTASGDGMKINHSVHAFPAGFGNSCPVPSTAVPCTTSTTTTTTVSNNNNAGVVYFTQQPYPAQPMMGYNYSIPYATAQQPSMLGQPPQSHCISQYTVYGPTQP